MAILCPNPNCHEGNLQRSPRAAGRWATHDPERYYRLVSIDPAKLTIVHYPAEVLRRKAGPVKPAEADMAAIADRMIRLMREAEGIGLAAPQVGLSMRMFVVDVPANPDESPDPAGLASSTRGPVVYINPIISAPTGAPEPHEEGCLSLPDIRGDVIRPPTVTITAHDLQGREFTQTGTGLLARCWQHELDHLDGVLILDRMTQMSRLRNRAAVRDLERAAKEL
ncbi:MAG: peptide deformylase [Phycisphaerales bacterium]|nr:peptide deformylase [Phycisphaerales bacterium]